MIRILTAICFSFLFPFLTLAQLTGTLSYGKYPVGFKVVDTKDNSGNPFRVCIWYPAATKGSPMQFKDYVDIPSLGGPGDKKVLRSELKKTVELIFDMGSTEIPQDKYENALNTNVNASLDAVMEKGNWPLILNDTEPVSLLVTNEFLASHGFVVALAATQYPAPENDRTLYQGPTRGLLNLLDYMLGQPNIDNDQVFAFGFGGGAMASFYTAMVTGKIKRFVNVEGGLFMPESKTTLSDDYKPANFNSTLLHIINPYILSKENSEEFNVIKSPKYRMMEKIRLQHHDFTTYGRIFNGLLQMRGTEAEDATAAFTELHQYIVWFIKEGKLNPDSFNSSRYFSLETIKMP